MSWTDTPYSSRHTDGHKLMYFPRREDASEIVSGWWAYPFGRREFVAGPFRTRDHAKDACDPENSQAWRTVPIPFAAAPTPTPAPAAGKKRGAA